MPDLLGPPPLKKAADPSAAAAAGRLLEKESDAPGSCYEAIS